MSAYVVEDKTINRIVSWLYSVGSNNGSRFYWCIQPLIDLGYKLDTQIGCKRLAEEMFTLNCDSIEQRYGEGSAEDFRPLDFNYQFTGSGVTQHQLVKSLQCFNYQCCEGNIPEQNALYDALDKVSARICKHIVSSSDAYEKAQWS